MSTQHHTKGSSRSAATPRPTHADIPAAEALPAAGHGLPEHLLRVSDLADEFDKVYPDELPERLEWLSENLQLQQEALLGLMGVEPPEPGKQPRKYTWQQIVKEYDRECCWLEDKLCQLLATFHFDWRGLSDYLHHQPEASFRVNRPGGEVPIEKLSPRDRDALLVFLVAQDNPQSIRALEAYLFFHTRAPER